MGTRLECLSKKFEGLQEEFIANRQESEPAHRSGPTTPKDTSLNAVQKCVEDTLQNRWKEYLQEIQSEINSKEDDFAPWRARSEQSQVCLKEEVLSLEGRVGKLRECVEEL